MYRLGCVGEVMIDYRGCYFDGLSCPSRYQVHHENALDDVFICLDSRKRRHSGTGTQANFFETAGRANKRFWPSC